MGSYVARMPVRQPRAHDLQAKPDVLPTIAAIETDNEPTFIGLYTIDGVPLYNVPDRKKVGF